MGKAKTSDRTRDVRCVAKLLRDGGPVDLLAHISPISWDKRCALQGVQAPTRAGRDGKRLRSTVYGYTNLLATPSSRSDDCCGQTNRKRNPKQEGHREKRYSFASSPCLGSMRFQKDGKSPGRRGLLRAGCDKGTASSVAHTKHASFPREWNGERVIAKRCSSTSLFSRAASVRCLRQYVCSPQ